MTWYCFWTIGLTAASQVAAQLVERRITWGRSTLGNLKAQLAAANQRWMAAENAECAALNPLLNGITHPYVPRPW